MRRFPWIRRLAADYAYDFPRVASFYAGDPAAHADWDAAIARTQAHPRRHDDIAAIVAAQQRRRQAPPRAIDAAAQLANGGTVAIVTGQQAGLFGGPLYTLLKALTAIKLAAEITDAHGVPAVAVFWIEAEDHDWDEVRSCTVFDKELAPRTLGLPPRAGDPSPVAAAALDASITAVIDELAATLAPTEFTPALIDEIRAAYAPGVGMADAFARWIERVLGARGLIVYDASDPAAKPLAAGLFARELSTPGQTGRLASTTGSDLVAHGYHAQVQTQDDTLALFHIDGARRAIRHDAGALVVGDERHAAAALLQEAANRPAAFSPGVLLRPIVQDTVFPTVCYVAGPNELAYLGQLRSVYGHFGVPMPLMYPRVSATIVDSAAFRFLTRYQLPLEALQPQDEAALNRLLESQIPPSVEAAFAATTAVIDGPMTTLAQAIAAVDPTLEGAAHTTRTRMRQDLDTLHNKMIQAAKRRHDTLRRQFAHARALAFPHGHAQERTIGFVSFLNQYGPALLDRLGEELPLDARHHWILAI